MEKLKDYIMKNYYPKDGARTSMWSEGNGDDQFSDGQAMGTAETLSAIAELIGMEVEPLSEQELD